MSTSVCWAFSVDLGRGQQKGQQIYWLPMADIGRYRDRPPVKAERRIGGFLSWIGEDRRPPRLKRIIADVSRDQLA
jgi:hypothetical protein